MRFPASYNFNLQDFLLQEEIERERERWNLSMALDASKPRNVGISMAFHGFPWLSMAHQRSGQREREEREKERKRREEEPMPQLLS